MNPIPNIGTKYKEIYDETTASSGVSGILLDGRTDKIRRKYIEEYSEKYPLGEGLILLIYWLPWNLP